MLGHPSTLRLPLLEIIPVFNSCTFSKMQAVRGELANHFFHQLCELIEGRQVT
jgi:hypothetical protein